MEEKRGPGRPKTERKERIPLGTPRRKLSFDNQDPNYVYRWVNDAPGRLQSAEAGGYEYVTIAEAQSGVGDSDMRNEDTGMGEKINAVVDRRTGQRAYLMKIKRQWYEEDQAEKSKSLDEFDDQLRRVQDQYSSGVERRYIPEGGMKISTPLRQRRA